MENVSTWEKYCGEGEFYLEQSEEIKVMSRDNVVLTTNTQHHPDLVDL